jgi:hypothetical protein
MSYLISLGGLLRFVLTMNFDSKESNKSVLTKLNHDLSNCKKECDSNSSKYQIALLHYCDD